MDELDKYFTDNTPLQITNKKNKEEENTNNNNYNIINLDNKKTIIQLHPLNSSLDDSSCYLYLLEVFFHY